MLSTNSAVGPTTSQEVEPVPTVATISDESEKTGVQGRLRALHCAVLIPTYNNRGTIEEVVSEALEWSEQVWVVNDGSTDGTGALLTTLEGRTQEGPAGCGSLHVITHPSNRGKGEALKTGFAVMLKAGMQNAVTFDADGQHKFQDLPLLLKAAEENPGALVVGTRTMAPDLAMPGKNKFANKFSNFWFRLETGLVLGDTQCGLRVYPIGRLSGIHFFSTKYELELEVLVRSSWAGIKLVPVGVDVCYPADRVTHFRPFQDFSRISVLNTVLVLVALFYIKPRNFFRWLSVDNIRGVIERNLLHCQDPPARIAAAVAVGVAIGVLPIWGYQIVTAVFVAHFCRLNKVITVLASNISFPPLTFLVIAGGYIVGCMLFGVEVSLPAVWKMSAEELLAVGKIYVVGACVLAAVLALVLGLATYGLLLWLRRRRK